METQINIETQIITKIINKKILDLLIIINKHYPNKFIKKNINVEFNIIKCNIIYNKNISSAKILHKTHKKTQIMQVKKVIEIKQPNKINITTRCHSRIWNNIYNRKTMIEISNIDRKFKVSDFADINIKEFNAKYIIGTQCQRKQTANSMYCFQHIKHLPHGNYFEIPTQEICYHYLKDCNYL